MTTWAGALVQTKGPREDLVTVFARHGITPALDDEAPPWLLVRVDVGFASLRPPRFAEALSADLRTTVISFFLQSTASVEQIEHWESGQLARKLEYSGDAGGWLTQSGSPRSWEATYFFAEDEGVDDETTWPHNLNDELSDEELARYRHARRLNDATSIMDLLSAGDADGIQRVCRHFGVDPNRPWARFTSARSWKPYWIAIALLLLLVAALVLGICTSKATPTGS